MNDDECGLHDVTSQRVLELTPAVNYRRCGDSSATSPCLSWAQPRAAMHHQRRSLRGDLPLT